MKNTFKLFNKDNDLFPCHNSICSYVLFLFLSTLFSIGQVKSQNTHCAFDELFNHLTIEDSDFKSKVKANEKLLRNSAQNSPEMRMNMDLHVLPVVFHVIHLGEPVGQGSNVSDALLMESLDLLNENFRNTNINNTGTDSYIEFCLAQRDPGGNATTGINRVNGYGVQNYEQIGIQNPAGNQAYIKDLSIWPNDEYVNIWVVHDVAGPASGFATFPGAPAALDGIVIDSEFLLEQTLTHEAGHFLQLHHTFYEGDEFNCPPNNDCTTDGDKVCDTPPHKMMFGCDATGLNDCDNNSPNSLFIHNYMGYASSSCRTEFTPGQITRMRDALEQLRVTLTYSLGCEEACNTVTADFNAVPGFFNVELGTQVDFFNASLPNATDFSWQIYGEEISSQEDMTYTFNQPGSFELCLFAENTDCINRKCITYRVVTDCVEPFDPCEEVVNGDFEQIAAATGSANISDPSQVCGWDATWNSPFYCSWPSNNAIGLFFDAHDGPWGPGIPLDLDYERITSQKKLDLQPGESCTISFDYLVTLNSPNTILVGLTENSANGEVGMPANANIIGSIVSPEVDVISQQNETCYPENTSFHHYSNTFTYSGDGKLFLNISGEAYYEFFGNSLFAPTSIIFIDNVSISCCDDECLPEPDFTVSWDRCLATFSGTNTGDEGTYEWDFGDGISATGQTVTHEYIVGETLDVCLTIVCDGDPESAAVVCKEITIDKDCDSCEPSSKTMTASRCEEVSNTGDSYVGNLQIQIPKGYTACEDDELFVWSSDVTILLESYDIDESNDNFDLLNIAVFIISPEGYDLEALGASGIVLLCDENGDMICRGFDIEAGTCDNCLPEIQSDAICDDPDTSDDVFVYSGSATFTLPPGPLQCGVTSSEAGFAYTYTLNGNDWTIDYTISTSDENLTDVSALLCFVIGTSKNCIPLNIDITEPCLVLPTECVGVWNEKTMTCTSQDAENVIFHIPNMTVFGPAEYSLCEGGLFGTVEGGTVEVNYASVNGLELTFDIDIVIPVANFVSGNVYDVRLYLCDALGNHVCYFMPYQLVCDGLPGGSGGRPDSDIVYGKSKEGNYSILPNPAKDVIYIISQDMDHEIQKQVRLLDQLGRTVKMLELNSDKQLMDVADLHPGIYFVAIAEEGISVKTEKVVIIR